MTFLGAILIGVGATLLIDLWALFLRRAFDVRSLDYCLLGRWVLHIPHGTIVHESIAKSATKRHECTVGWTTHYLIGMGFALVFVLLASDDWLARPTLPPALAFGIVTVLVPFCTMQPSFGLGIAASKTPHPNRARLKSLTTHAVFGEESCQELRRDRDRWRVPKDATIAPPHYRVMCATLSLDECGNRSEGRAGVLHAHRASGH